MTSGPIAACAGRVHSAQFERGSDILECNHQSHRLSRARIKTKRDVEFSRLFRNGVDNDSPNPDHIRRMRDAAGGVSKERPS